MLFMSLMCVCVPVHACIFACVCVCMYICVCMEVHMCLYVGGALCVCASVCSVYVCVHSHMEARGLFGYQHQSEDATHLFFFFETGSLIDLQLSDLAGKPQSSACLHLPHPVMYNQWELSLNAVFQVLKQKNSLPLSLYGPHSINTCDTQHLLGKQALCQLTLPTEVPST